MANENLESGVDVIEDAEVDYVEAINQLKQNTVSKESYAKLRTENKRLMEALINGEQIEAEKSTPVDLKALREKLFDPNAQLSNLEYVESALKLRSELIERGERDPFLPIGSHVRETAEMYERAQNVADVLQECVDLAQGDSGIFTAQLQRKIKDPAMYRGR
jgi:hypothetical protein